METMIAPRARAVLFDLDGTLLNTLGDIASSMNLVLRDAGFPEHAPERYRYFVGEGMATLVERALPAERRDAATVEATLAAMRRVYAEHQFDTTVPYNGIPELLGTLAARGLALAVLSNKPDGATAAMIARYFPNIAFAAVRGQRPDVARKPDPAGAVAIARELGYAPADFIYVGDTAIDMRTAVSAGMYPVGVTWGFREAGELRAAGAAVLIDAPGELLELV